MFSITLLTNFSATSFLEYVLQLSTLFFVISEIVLLSPPKISGFFDISFAKIQSQFFLLNFSLAFLIRLSVSAAKPITNLGLLFFLLEMNQMF